MADLLAQFPDRKARANDAVVRRGGLLGLAEGEGPQKQLPENRGLAWLRDEVHCAQRARMPRIGFIVLPGQHDDLDVGCCGQQFDDQAEALVRAVWRRWQAQVDQGEAGYPLELSDEVARLLPGPRRKDAEVLAENEIEGVGDERIVVDDQQVGLPDGLGIPRLCYPRDMAVDCARTAEFSLLAASCAARVPPGMQPPGW